MHSSPSSFSSKQPSTPGMLRHADVAKLLQKLVSPEWKHAMETLTEPRISQIYVQTADRMCLFRETSKLLKLCWFYGFRDIIAEAAVTSSGNVCQGIWGNLEFFNFCSYFNLFRVLGLINKQKKKTSKSSSFNGKLLIFDIEPKQYLAIYTFKTLKSFYFKIVVEAVEN